MSEDVRVEIPAPVPASQHVGIVPFVPSIEVKPTLVERIRGWLS